MGVRYKRKKPKPIQYDAYRGVQRSINSGDIPPINNAIFSTQTSKVTLADTQTRTVVVNTSGRTFIEIARIAPAQMRITKIAMSATITLEDQNTDAPDVTARVQVSTDGGTTWTTLDSDTQTMNQFSLRLFAVAGTADIYADSILARLNCIEVAGNGENYLMKGADLEVEVSYG